MASYTTPQPVALLAKVPPTSVPSLTGVGRLLAGAEHVREPRHVVVVEVVGLELGVQARDVDVEGIAGPELQAEIGAGAHAVLREQRRAEQVRHRRNCAALVIDRAVRIAEEFDAVAADIALLVDAGEQEADSVCASFFQLNSAPTCGSVESASSVYAPCSEAVNVIDGRSSGLRVLMLTVPPMPPSSMSACEPL